MTVLTGVSAAANERDRERQPAGAATRLWRASPLTYVALIVACLVSVFPLYFMLVGASRTNPDISKVPPPLTPGGNLFDNVGRVFDNVNTSVLHGLENSLLISSAVTVSTVFFGSLA